MESNHLSPRVAAFAAVLIISACGSSNMVSFGSPGSGSGFTRWAAKSGSLLYVANRSESAGVDIRSFPDGKHVARISNVGYPQGVCADAAGHVWVTAYVARRDFRIYEFARGVTMPVRTVRRHETLGECTVDPSGRPVVFADETAYRSSVETWSPSLRGRPHSVAVELSIESGAYDPDGNLYLDGSAGSDPAFSELPKGSRKLTSLFIVRNHHSFANGSIGWDGAYVTAGSFRDGEVIVRLIIDGRKAKISSVVRSNGVAGNAQYALGDGQIVAALAGKNSTSKRIGVFTYPAGGKPVAVFSGFDNPAEIAISQP